MAKCSICKKSGHNKRTCKEKINKEITSNQKIPFKSGQKYEEKIYNILLDLLYENNEFKINKLETSKSNSDIMLIINDKKIGIEIKNLGAFEGGCKKLYL
jgi:hypothetical protein